MNKKLNKMKRLVYSKCKNKSTEDKRNTSWSQSLGDDDLFEVELSGVHFYYLFSELKLC